MENLLQTCREWWPAARRDGATAIAESGWHLPGSGAPTATVFDGTNIKSTTLDFGNAGVNSIQRTCRLPTDWRGAIDLYVYWRTPASAGNVVWQVQTAFAGPSFPSVDPSFDPAFNAADVVVSAAPASAGDLKVATLAGIDLTDAVKGDLLFLKLFRDSGHGSDTVADVASLIGVEIVYRRLALVGE